MLTLAALVFVQFGLFQPTEPRPERRDAANEPSAAATASSEAAELKRRKIPGLMPDGAVLLPNQWSLRPVGAQVELGDFPVNIALHPSSKYAAVLHAGHGTHEVVILTTADRRIVSRVTVPQTFCGLCFDGAGGRLFVSGAENEVVYAYTFDRGLLAAPKQLAVLAPEQKFMVCGLSISADDHHLFAAGVLGDALADIDLASGQSSIHPLSAGSAPYSIIATPDGDHLFVSLWGGAAVVQLDAKTFQETARWETPSHPTEMVFSPDRETLLVACANSNLVAALDLERPGSVRQVISSALYPTAPNGSTPNSLSLSPDGSVLLVANADNNNIAVLNVSEPGNARSMGFIPAGWYPTSVRFLPDGSILYTSGKGLSPKANPHGPNPLQRHPGGIREYIGGLFRGSLGFVPRLSPERLREYTADAYQCSPLQEGSRVVTKPREADNPIPAKVGDKSPIKHVIYIIKENRTYDQVFGDMPEGNGDPELCLFPEKVTPNHHALAREFVLLDNFYVEGEVSADGHEWSMGAYATDFVEKTWPQTYRPRVKNRKLGHPAEGGYELATPAGGYLWDRAKAAGVSYRSYGEWVENGEKHGDPGRARSPALEGHFDPYYRSYDLSYSDLDRAERFISELKRFETEGDMPALQIVRLPNDHTSGTSKGQLTPTAFVAQNDLALGRLVDAVSRSRFWATTAIFVVEDDAQNGPDHVDAHRTVALVISPYCRRHIVDSSMYSTASMLRTMELILGLEPMSQFDAAALPMYASFSAAADVSPYAARPAQVDLEARNTALAWGADVSEHLDLSREDAADDLVLNEIVWKSVRGEDSPMPPPVRAAFVFTRSEHDEPDEHDDD